MPARLPRGRHDALGTDLLGHDFTWCRDIGLADVGASCVNQYDGAAGLFCYADGLCHPFCDPANAAATCAGMTCDPVASFAARAPVGACVP